MRGLQRLGVLLVVGLLGVVPGLEGFGTALAAGPVTYYVATTGTDPASCPGGGNSASTPFATIGFAVGCAAADTTGGAATASGPDTITIAAGIYHEYLGVNADVNLVGVAGQTTIDGSGSGRIVDVGAGYTVGVSNLTLENGSAAADDGGAILNRGTMTITDSTLSGNFASFGGGAISNSGTMTLTDSTLSGNGTAFAGSAIQNGGTLTVTNSTFSKNYINACGCSPTGGAVIFATGGTASFSNSTISGNTESLAPADPSDTGGGVIWAIGGAVGLAGTIVANNTGGNCTGTITDNGYNLEDDPGAICGFSSGNHDIVGQDPKLDPNGLQANGGPTQTVALQVGSPAIDAIPNASTVCSGSSADQRGAARPDDGESSCDIGAYESNFSSPAISQQPGDQTITAGNAVTLSVMATGNPAPSYQWYSSATGAGESFSAIPGATQASYTTPTLTAAGVTYYYAQVSNTVGSVTSNTVKVTVDPAELDHFTVSTPSSPQTAGVAFIETVTAQDQYGNVAASFTGPVAISDTLNAVAPTTSGGFTAGLWTGAVTVNAAGSDVITASSGVHSGMSAGFPVDTNLSSYSTLSNVNLKGAYLVAANLAGDDLSDSNLSGATLTGANLSNADLTDTNLSGANLTGANLSGTNLTQTNLKGATGLIAGQLTGVSWNKTTCPDGTNSSKDGGTCLNNLNP